jgi:hypothetical protein
MVPMFFLMISKGIACLHRAMCQPAMCRTALPMNKRRMNKKIVPTGGQAL